MKIKHHNNSFFELKDLKNDTIVFDPWIGDMIDTGTWSYPNMSSNKRILNRINPNLIYISHLHTDHYDIQILSKYTNKKNTKILIKKFKDQRLKKKILSLGYSKIIELEAWKTFDFKGYELTIVPCDQMVNSGISGQIQYDLDTSIIVYNKNSNVCFYNHVDNPCSSKIIKAVKIFCKKKYGKIDIVSMAPRSACEYPQMFLSIKDESKKKIQREINLKSLINTNRNLKILSAKNYIPAGGNFILYGKFSHHQKFVAHPTTDQIDNFFKKTNFNYFNIDNCGQVELRNGKVTSYHKGKKINENVFLKEGILKKKKYEYQKINSIKKIDEYFEKAKNNYYRLSNIFKLNINFEINIFLYKNLKTNINGNIINKKIFKEYSLKNIKAKSLPNKLDLHLDAKLFYSLIAQKTNWNMATGGSLIIFNRKPNIHIPDITFSLNFLRI